MCGTDASCDKRRGSEHLQRQRWIVIILAGAAILARVEPRHTQGAAQARAWLRRVFTERVNTRRTITIGALFGVDWFNLASEQSRPTILLASPTDKVLSCLVCLS